MEWFFRYWWLGFRLLIHVGIAWVLAGLPITIGGLVFREAIQAQSTLGIALTVCGVIYGLVALPAVFAVLALPLPADTPPGQT